MYIRSAAGPLVAVLMAASAAPLAGQTADLPPEVQAMVLELQQVQAQLEPVRAEAMQDTALQQQHQEVTEAVLEAMVKADPDTQQRIERMQQIMAQAAEAQQAGAADRLPALAAEAQALQERLDATQREVMAQPAVEQRLAAYRTALHARMTAIDPDAAGLLERAERLERQIMAALDGG
jgi:hypothetical protein